MVEEDGPFQHGGAYIPMLDLHVRRLLNEYKWRTTNCGGELGYKDVDSRTLSYGDLLGLLEMLIVDQREIPEKIGHIAPKSMKMVKDWRKLASELGNANPMAGHLILNIENYCSGKGGYRDTKNYP